MKSKNQKIVIDRRDLKVRDKYFIENKLKYKMTIVESKKKYNRKRLKKTINTEEIQQEGFFCFFTNNKINKEEKCDEFI